MVMTDRRLDVGAELELDIDAIAAGGDGVGRDASGRVVFVPLAAPGDRVRARVLHAGRRWARAGLTGLVKSSDLRRMAPCPVFGACGGCRLQHLPESAQADAKSRIVADALQRIGGLDVAVAPAFAPGRPLAYRNRVSLTLRDARAGFHALLEPDVIVEPPTCLLAESPVRAAWTALAPFGDLPRGGDRRLTIRATRLGGIALLVEGGTDPGRPPAVVDAVDGLESYWWFDARGARHHLAAGEVFREIVYGFEFRLAPDAFVQVNRYAAEAIDRWLDERAGPVEGLRVADVYSGIGARALRWAARGATVSTCEVHAGACAATREAANKAGLAVDVHEGRAEEFPNLFDRDLVVVNPPRAGLGARVREHLLRNAPGRIAYVSCDPATLARDLKDLAAGYRVAAVQPFDAFPQTGHVETVAWLEAESLSPDLSR